MPNPGQDMQLIIYGGAATSGPPLPFAFEEWEARTRAALALDALPEVCEVVEGRVPVLLDSGVRRGPDVLKAIALGASAVLIGRPFAYALASDGEAGVRHLIRTLIADVDLTLALSGRTSVDEVDRSLLERD